MNNDALLSLKGIIECSPIDDLNKLPNPMWEIFPVKKFGYSPNISLKPFLPILSSRGCPYSCGHYCPYPLVQGAKFRKRSVSNIIEEIKYLKEKHNIRGLLFRDPVFTFDKKRAMGIAQEIIDNNLNLRWACETRLDCLDEELIDLLHLSGLRSINVGIESYNGDILKNISRIPIKQEHQERIINYCKKKRIKISAFYILGLPEDNKESVLETINYAKKLNTHVAQFTICTPFPGTKNYENVKSNILTPNFEDFNSYDLVVKHKNFTKEELEKLKEEAFVKYYFRFKYIKKFIGSKIHEIIDNWS